MVVIREVCVIILYASLHFIQFLYPQGGRQYLDLLDVCFLSTSSS